MISIVLNLLGLLFCTISVIACYSASKHCRWSFLNYGRDIGFGLRLLMILMALAALITWEIILGLGVSLCLLLGCWGLSAITFPLIIHLIAGKTS